MPTMRPRFQWDLGRRSLPLGERTLVMGVLNVTPISFSDGGRYFDPRAAIDHGHALLDEGADILDIGGESTRPGTPLDQRARAPQRSVTRPSASGRQRPAGDRPRAARPRGLAPRASRGDLLYRYI